MSPEQVQGFAYRDAIQACREYYLKGWPNNPSCALIVTIMDKIERDAREIFQAAQPGKEFPK